jgi:hypothetical protein
MFRNGDSKSVGRLRSFGFLGKTYYPQKTGTPPWKSWNFHPECIQKETCGSAAGLLLRQSSALIERIPFEVMVQHALGRHFPELTDLYRKYEWLHAQIYSHFVNRRKNAKYLVQVKKVCSPHPIPHDRTLTRRRHWKKVVLILSSAP